MSTETARDAGQIWRQGVIPVLYRDTAARQLLCKLPYAADNRQWIQAEKVRHPEWIPRYHSWRIPQRWLNELVPRALIRFGAVYLIQPYRTQEQCAPACWDAHGFLCECSCLGEHHGENTLAADGWHIVSDACAIRWGHKQLSCRLLRWNG